MFGICHLSIVPCRKEPSDSSEMVTQLLFGETFEVISSNDKWYCIRSTEDQYMSWVDRKQVMITNWTSIPAYEKYYVGDLQPAVAASPGGEQFPIVIGSPLPDYQAGTVGLGGETYTVTGRVIRIDQPHVDRLMTTAQLFLHSPYLWGGRTPWGIDCSGYVQMVFRLHGIALMRDCAQQVTQGEMVEALAGARAGDLAFFKNDQGRVVHVGIVMENGKIIHASGQVRIDTLTTAGIIHRESQSLTHHLCSIRRYF